MKNYTDILSMNITDFFRFVKTIKYGYQDTCRQLHYENDLDFLSYDYIFSPAEEVVKNNCGWCWDVANLIIDYCTTNQIAYKSYFLSITATICIKHTPKLSFALTGTGMWHRTILPT